jgi:uncharacterized pyridoxal phosphate-containing UPF0001 family protein
VPALVQVNVAGESTKHGLNPRAVRAFVEQVHAMVGIELRGLMCMAPLTDEPESVRPVFERTKDLFDEIRTASIPGLRFDLLSMGMSGDFEIAVESGATLVRVGTALFGSGPAVAEEDEHR